MSDIELVIKIPKEMYEWINDANKFHRDYGVSDFVDIVKNGIALPSSNQNCHKCEATCETCGYKGENYRSFACLTCCKYHDFPLNWKPKEIEVKE